MAERGKRKMEKKHVSFTKDGMKVGVRGINDEDYADKTQRYCQSSSPSDRCHLLIGLCAQLPGQGLELFFLPCL